ncbi:MAG TPA: lipocalin-like domain-containing protein, partial [Promineifilum sp.]|nr:lipocalin-like domain-containing protein [Promineifilum sp.]
MSMKRLLWIAAALAVIVVAAVASRPLWARQAAPPLAASLEALPAAGAIDGFARATQPGAIVFPRDLGPHDDYQTEWWYYTGNLTTADGRPFGFQFTIFRRALTPPGDGDTAAADGWRSNQVYLAHFAISDIAADAFYPAERFSRGAAGLAGATATPYRVWLEDWSVEEIAAGQVRLRARTDAVALDLILTQTLPPVLHGDGGLSQKGPEAGNASYYYSIVQQAAAGTVTAGGEAFDVTGRAWKDHEWSTSALSEGAVGWDWLSLQLDDGSALMLFEIRRADGTREAFSAGSYIAPDGTLTPLALGDWTLAVTDTWTSPTSGAEYPAGWRITIPSLGLELTGAPQMDNQELNLSTVYWEGAVAFSGTRDGAPVSAQGYSELTGYAGSMEGR